MDDNTESRNRYVSRRQMMQAAGAGTAFLLAGCSNGGDDTPASGDGTATGDGQTGTPVDATLATFERHWMNEADLNPFSSSRASGLAWHLFPQLSMYSTAATFDQEKRKTYNEFPKLGASDWSFDGKEFSVTLRDDWQWTSGDEVTAADLALRLRLMKYEDAPIWNYLDSISEDGDKTLTLTLNDEYDQGLVMQTLFGAGMQLDTPVKVNGSKTQYAKSLEELESASTSTEEDNALQTLVEFNWYPEDAVLSGPFAVSDVSKSELLLERHDGFYDPVNFTSASFRTLDLGQTGSPAQAISSGEIDLSGLPTPEVAASFPDNIHTVARQGSSGIGYGFNYSDPGGGVLKERNVRRAVAFLLSSKNCSQNSNPLKAGVIEEPPTCLIGASEWIGSDKLSNFNTYEPDQERATSLLKEAGLSKESGTWMTSGGKEFSIKVTTAPWIVYPAIGQTIVSTLQDFGINATLESLGSDAFVNTLWGDGTFQTSLGAWGGTHPANAFNGVFGKNNVWNTPAKLEVPMPVGDPEGDLQTINVRERTSKLASLSGDKLKSEVETLAWAFNQTLPIIPLVTENGGMSYSTNGWSYPDREDPIWGTGRPREALFANGLVDAN